MDIQTLSTSMGNQAVASAITPGTMNVPKADDGGTAKAKSGDTVDISAEARVASASSTSAQPSTPPSTSTSDFVAKRITKLQQQLQQLQGSANLPDEEKRSKVTALRSQIMQLQNQEKTGGGSAGTAATPLKTSHV